MSEEEKNDQVFLILLSIGFSQNAANELLKLATENSTIRDLILKNDIDSLKDNKEANKIIKKDPPRISGVTQVLIDAGLSITIAGVIANAFSEDDQIPGLIDEGKRPLIFMTQQDSKVDDLICLPLEGTVWDIDDPQRPQIPATTHPNCRCFWIDPTNGANLGQF
jgi:hypothetical protein